MLFEPSGDTQCFCPQHFTLATVFSLGSCASIDSRHHHICRGPHFSGELQSGVWEFPQQCLGQYLENYTAGNSRGHPQALKSQVSSWLSKRILFHSLLLWSPQRQTLKSSLVPFNITHSHCLIVSQIQHISAIFLGTSSGPLNSDALYLDVLKYARFGAGEMAQ